MALKIDAKKKKKKKKICGPNWDRDNLFYSNVVERPLKRACFLCAIRVFFNGH